MITEEQKIWIIKERAASRSPITVERYFFKKFAVKGRKKLDNQESRFREIFDHFVQLVIAVLVNCCIDIVVKDSLLSSSNTFKK